MNLRKLSALGPLLILSIAIAGLGGACSATGARATGATAAGAGGGTSSNGQGAATSSSGQSGTGGSTVHLGADGGGGGPTAPPSSGCDTTSCQAAGGQCMNTTCVINENPGNVPAATQGSLQQGGNGDSAFAFLYPYDKTVFPRGLLPPTLQFAGAAPDAVYVHVSFPGLEYKGFFGASSPGRLAFSSAVWEAIGLASNGFKDEVQVEVTKISGGMVAGPITENWTIATGNLKGTIYYETYGSRDPRGGRLGGDHEIQPGATTPTMVKKGCGHVCHTASADGSTLVSAIPLTGSESWDFKNNAAAIAKPVGKAIAFTYGGLYPDGSFSISATHYRTWFPSVPSRLYDTKTGANIPTPSWDSAIKNGGTPAFSPDGTKVAFIHEDLDSGQGHTIAAMDYDPAQKTFSKLVDLANDPMYTLGWPAFTPDTKSVVYHAGSNAQFETDGGAVGDVFYVDVATHKVTRLDALDGYDSSGKVYLPDNDAHLSFAPTVLPVAVGGYFWVVFTSHRSYGNTLPSMDNGDQNGKLWVAAFDINATPGQDPSHPAFFLDGQEKVSDNLRGFWVLNPCGADGDNCASGDDCCGGYCRSTNGGPLQCVSAPGGCSNEFETCKTAADCCTPGFQCINSHCAQPAPT